MKNFVAIIAVGLLTCFSVNAQGLDFGIKGGANFANLKGGEVDGSNRTGFHIGALVELNIAPNFSIQPEVMYSSQGAKFEEVDKEISYLSVPVLAKFYVLPEVLSFEAGPQFSFKTDENSTFEEAVDNYESKSFDFALAAGATVNVFKGFFASARYVVGLTEMSKEAEYKNHVVQVSVGFKF